MVRIDLFVVLYMRSVQASQTLDSLRRLDCDPRDLQLRVHIWDNSPEPDRDGAAALPAGWDYVCSQHNTALSLVYNRLLRSSTAPHVMILDQDSDVGQALIDKLVRCIRDIDADMYVPVIRHQEQMISPGRLRWIKGAPLRKAWPDAFLPPYFTAMMSGLCISRRFLRELGPAPFDERLWFYGIDTRLCRELNWRGGRAYLYDAVLGHDSALRDTRDPLQLMRRRIWLMRSWKYVFDADALERLGVHAYVLWSAWRLARRRGVSQGFFAILAEVYR